MPKPERRSMSQLPPPVSMPPVDVTRAQEKTVLKDAPAEASTPADQPDSQQASQPAMRLEARPGKGKAEPKIALTTRIPQSLKTRLVRIARYNDIEIEAIIVRALEQELELEIYAKPERWGREDL
jgi:hypothetical protein